MTAVTVANTVLSRNFHAWFFLQSVMMVWCYETLLRVLGYKRLQVWSVTHSKQDNSVSVDKVAFKQARLLRRLDNGDWYCIILLFLLELISNNGAACWSPFVYSWDYSSVLLWISMVCLGQCWQKDVQLEWYNRFHSSNSTFGSVFGYHCILCFKWWARHSMRSRKTFIMKTLLFSSVFSLASWSEALQYKFKIGGLKISP